MACAVAAPSVRLAGPRVVVFSGSSAQPHAWGSPSDGTSLWYTCGARARVTHSMSLQQATMQLARGPARHAHVAPSVPQLRGAPSEPLRARTIPLPLSSSLSVAGHRAALRRVHSPRRVRCCATRRA